MDLNGTPTLLCILATVLLSVGGLQVTASVSSSHCPENHFQPRGHHHPHHPHPPCQLCRTCPKDQIIRKPCSKHRDTICGPFVEFNNFHQAPKRNIKDLPLPEEGGGGEGDGDYEDEEMKELWDMLDHGDQKNSHHGDRSSEGFVDVQVKVYPEGDGLVKARRNRPGVMGGHGEGEGQWKVLALALIVVLSIVCVFLIVFVFVVCYLRSHRAHHTKKVLYSSSAENGTRTPRTYPSRYQPVTVLTTLDRGGTSGAAASCNAPVVYTDDYDADNSGQTISTTKSSDYVYFKSPNNGNHSDDVNYDV